MIDNTRYIEVSSDELSYGFVTAKSLEELDVLVDKAKTNGWYSMQRIQEAYSLKENRIIYRKFLAKPLATEQK